MLANKDDSTRSGVPIPRDQEARPISLRLSFVSPDRPAPTSHAARALRMAGETAVEEFAGSACVGCGCLSHRLIGERRSEKLGSSALVAWQRPYGRHLNPVRATRSSCQVRGGRRRWRGSSSESGPAASAGSKQEAAECDVVILAQPWGDAPERSGNRLGRPHTPSTDERPHGRENRIPARRR